MTEVSTAGSRSRLVLPVLCVAQFMVILDVSIVNIALPSIQRSLHVSQENLQWVVIAYGLALGGFLLLGGRSADILGRRRVLMGGVSLFTLCSLGCGLSRSIGLLVTFRALQGLGAAFTAPAALSTLTTVFREGSERNKALGIWGALGGAGAAVGVLLGGAITNSLGWEWIFFLNVPVGILLVLAAPRVLPESLGDAGHRRFDVAGAVSVTSGLVLGVYAVNRSIDHGWTTSVTLICLAASIVLLASFLVIESRTTAPLLDLSIFRIRSVSVANVLAILVFGVLFSEFFMLSLLMQQVLHYSALKTGLAYLPLAVLVIVSSTVASQVVTRIGPKPVLALGMALMGTALLVFFVRAPSNSQYLTDLLPGYLLVAIGLGFSVVSVQVAAFSGVSEDEAGMGAGLINTSQEVGGAVVIAVLATIAVAGTRHFVVAHGSNPASVTAGLTHGFHLAFGVAGGLALAAVAITLLMLPGVAHRPAVAALVRPVSPKPIHHHIRPHLRTAADHRVTIPSPSPDPPVSPVALTLEGQPGDTKL